MLKMGAKKKARGRAHTSQGWVKKERHELRLCNVRKNKESTGRGEIMFRCLGGR